VRKGGGWECLSLFDRGYEIVAAAAAHLRHFPEKFVEIETGTARRLFSGCFSLFRCRRKVFAQFPHMSRVYISPPLGSSRESMPRAVGQGRAADVIGHSGGTLLDGTRWPSEAPVLPSISCLSPYTYSIRRFVPSQFSRVLLPFPCRQQGCHKYTLHISKRREKGDGGPGGGGKDKD
jgi:hypothetical protein